ncbi:MAG TPA: type IV toxin-antitoxin system AbiEi family antitoxin domain-containing protein, partial [Candidatus Eisenbacteria bacterium]|nr:type IV toxin-antitoxin system AbiEi family antitoxin domain-containing protein [Candidatus Eisenbacteria bacterium]
MDLLHDGQPFGVREAAATGLSRQRLRSRVLAGKVRRVLVGVYVDARVPESISLRAAALAKVTPPDMVVCRGTAAWLLGVPPVEPNRHQGVPEIELASPAGRNGTRRGDCVGSSALLDEGDVIEVDGVPVTSGVRTCLDLARHRDRPDALAYVDALVRHGVAAKRQLLDALCRLDGLPWAEQGREIVELCDPRAESPGESWLRLRHLDAGFPPPEPQLRVLDEAGRPVVRLDLGLLAQRVAEEYDGEEFHGRDQQPRDTARRSWLETRDWTLLSFGKGEVLGRGFAFERAVGEAL